jgi:DNA-directed RNA polymerase subunit RPC12/RpoP
MSWFKPSWLCKIFGHRLVLVNDLREGAVKRQRVVYRCLRCGQPVIVCAKAPGETDHIVEAKDDEVQE